MGKQKPQIDPVIRRAPLSSLSIYEIDDNDLNQIEQSASGGVLLNFATSLISISATLLTTLLTFDFGEHRLKFDAFVLVCASALIAGIVCLAVWWRSHTSTRAIIARIRRRMSEPKGVQQPGGIVE